MKFIVALFSVFSISHAAKIPAYPLPDYVGKGCSFYDPNLNDCVVRTGAPAVARIAGGDPKYRIPKLDPLVIDELKVGRGTRQVGLTMTCTKCKMFGLQYTKLVGADVRLDENTCRWDFHLDHLKVIGQYSVDGRVLLLPITGSGLANFTFSDVDFSYFYDWTFEERENGLHYVKLNNSKLDFEVKKMHIDLENLFNGDKLLGDNMNLFLNENWPEILKDVGPALSDSLAQVFKTTLIAMADVVPFENLFPKE